MENERTTRGEERNQQALWYAWGREDAGDRRLRDASHYRIVAIDFADFAADEADAYDRQQRTMLSCIVDQYDRYVNAVTAGSRFTSDVTGDVWHVDAYLAIANESHCTLVGGPHGVPSTLPIGSRITFTPNVLAGYRLLACGLGSRS